MTKKENSLRNKLILRNTIEKYVFNGWCFEGLMTHYYKCQKYSSLSLWKYFYLPALIGWLEMEGVEMSDKKWAYQNALEYQINYPEDNEDYSKAIKLFKKAFKTKFSYEPKKTEIN